MSSELIGILKPEICYISAKGNRKHPSRAIVNCLKKNGAVGIYSTHKNNQTINYTSDDGGYPIREGWIPLESI